MIFYKFYNLFCAIFFGELAKVKMTSKKKNVMSNICYVVAIFSLDGNQNNTQ